jgi:hypothetical protein
MMGPNRIAFPMLVLSLSILSACVCAVVFVALEQLSLPRTDLAYGRPLGTVLSDPFVVIIAGAGASMVGLVLFPIALFCLRGRDLLRCGLLVLGLTVLFISVTTPIAPQLALVGGPVVALGGLLFCRYTRLGFFQPHERLGDVA